VEENAKMTDARVCILGDSSLNFLNTFEDLNLRDIYENN